MDELRQQLFVAELESRGHAESPDDLLDDWLIPVLEAYLQAVLQRAIAAERRRVLDAINRL